MTFQSGEVIDEQEKREGCVTLLGVRFAAMFPRTWPRGDTLQATSHAVVTKFTFLEFANGIVL